MSYSDGAIRLRSTARSGKRPCGRHAGSSPLHDVWVWRGVFDRLGVPEAVWRQVARRAATNGTSIQAEFSARSIVGEERFYRCLAEELGVAFSAAVKEDDILVGEEQ